MLHHLTAKSDYTKLTQAINAVDPRAASGSKINSGPVDKREPVEC